MNKENIEAKSDKYFDKELYIRNIWIMMSNIWVNEIKGVLLLCLMKKGKQERKIEKKNKKL